MTTGPSVFGFRWATERKLPVRRFTPEWDKLGKPAGIICGREMATFADALIALTDGTQDEVTALIKYSRNLDPKLRVFVMQWQPSTQTLVNYGQQQSNSNIALPARVLA